MRTKTIESGTATTSGLADRVAEYLLSRNSVKSDPIREVDIAAAFGVSRTTMREALAKLESVGVIQRRQKKGVYLRVPSAQEISEIFDIRAVLEGLACRLAILRMKRGYIGKLRTLARQYERGLKNGDIKSYSKADRGFHEELAVISGNSMIGRILFPLYVQRCVFVRLGWEPAVERRDPNPVTHLSIVAALEEGDGKQAEDLIRSHIQYSKRRRLEHAIGIGSMNTFD